ncbi:secretion protein HlyD family protein [Ferrimonas balearica DSM 9799]|uniref:Secretion protein HlyD family protein n=2 Tax=Ferrimonas balearica TaxID=44012 RepID=E1SWC3_FERBD|nr:secretion protein HlyD family protein [Ferrimonas balearica DSM 9799]
MWSGQMKKPLIAVLALGLVGASALYYGIGSSGVSTDNAYVKADLTLIAPQVSGQVVGVAVSDNQWVEQGDELFRLDDRDYRAALSQAQAAVALADAGLASNDSRTALQRVQIEQARAQIASAEANASLQQAELKRYRQLVTSGSVSQTQFDVQSARAVEAQTGLDNARLALKAAEQQLATLASERVQLEAQRQQAEAQHQLSAIALERTIIRAPMAGRVANRQVQIGKLVQPGMAALTLVPEAVWLEANFKETQLAQMAAGQAVEVVLDGYPDQPISGEVDSVTHATGAQFSLLPPQNATGNFVKVVQRVPVKIRLQLPAELKDRVYPGLSATVTVKP